MPTSELPPDRVDPAETTAESASFEDVVAAANFTDVDPRFEPDYENVAGAEYAAQFQGLIRGKWDNRGDRVRGRFEVIEMEGSGDLVKEYTVPDAEAEAAKVPGRHLATAYETAAYAALGVENGKTPTDQSDDKGWNGVDWVAGFGSSCTDVAYREPFPEVPSLWTNGNPGDRRLTTITTGYPQRPITRVLCVVEEQASQPESA